MGVCDGQLILDSRAILEQDLNASAEGFFGVVDRVVSASPLFVIPSFNAAPEPDSIRAAGAFRRVALDMVPAAILQSHGEDIHDGMIESFPAGHRIELLRIVRTRGNNRLRVGVV